MGELQLYEDCAMTKARRKNIKGVTRLTNNQAEVIREENIVNDSFVRHQNVGRSKLCA